METVHLLAFTMPIQMPIFQISKETGKHHFIQKELNLTSLLRLSAIKYTIFLHPDAYLVPSEAVKKELPLRQAQALHRIMVSSEST